MMPAPGAVPVTPYDALFPDVVQEERKDKGLSVVCLVADAREVLKALVFGRAEVLYPLYRP
jgi:hypothetical protein